MQEMQTVLYTRAYHSELLRNSEYTRLAQAVSAQPPTGVNLYRLVGQRLVNWGEALQRANAHRRAATCPDYRLVTSEQVSL